MIGGDGDSSKGTKETVLVSGGDDEDETGNGKVVIVVCVIGVTRANSSWRLVFS